MTSRPEDEQVVGEARWPMTCAVIAAIVLTVLLRSSVETGPHPIFPAIEGVLLVVLIVGDPGRIDRRARWLRTASIALVAILVGGALWATGLLLDDLINGGGVTNSASELLQAGGTVWLLTVIAFALLYWELDGGGPAERAHHLRKHPDLAFPQQMTPELAPAGWRPQFVDYLYLGFTNATAFSPTDVMPLRAWAKIAMAIQSTISIVILGLVIARAVNVFT